MRRSARTLLTLTTVAALTVPASLPAAGTGSTADAASAARTAGGAAPAVPEIAWGSCGKPELAAFQCASVEVPTDYDRPNGPTTTIALTRLPASDPARRIGTLFTNPGGPGGSGVDFVQQSAFVAYSPQVRARFDILGFDPRGVGRSDPATCYPTAAEEAAVLNGLPPFPVGRAEDTRFTLASARIGLSCTKTSPDRLAHYSTANVARDMELLRRAVGDQKLSYVGYSYGTYLGATYAKLFPNRIRALVLDGTLHPEWYTGSDGDPRPIGVRLRQGEGGAETFAQFKAECAAAGPSRCALAGLGDPGTVVEQLFERLKTRPVELTFPDGSTLRVTYAVAVQATFFSLYSPQGWPDLAALLAQLAVASQSKSAAAVRVSAGVAALPGWNQRKEEYASIGTVLQPCVETRQTGRPLAYPAYAAAADKVAPHFGRMRAWIGQQCEFLPIRDTDAFRGPWTKLKVAEPVIVFGTRYDPATPYQATRPYADLYRDARLVTVEGWGHTTIGKSVCADHVITRYLVDLAPPAGNSVCEPDRRPFDPLPQAKSRGKAPADLPAGLPLR